MLHCFFNCSLLSVLQSYPSWNELYIVSVDAEKSFIIPASNSCREKKKRTISKNSLTFVWSLCVSECVCVCIYMYILTQHRLAEAYACVGTQISLHVLSPLLINSLY